MAGPSSTGGDAGFDGARFSGNAGFEQARFSENATFSGTRFSGTTRLGFGGLGRTTFEREPELANATASYPNSRHDWLAVEMIDDLDISPDLP